MASSYQREPNTLLSSEYTTHDAHHAHAFHPCTIIPTDEIKRGTKLGEGAFGVVYSGTYEHAEAEDNVVAIKVIKGELTENAKQDLLREAGIMQRLISGDVVRVYGVVIDSHSAAMVMEHMSDGSLYKLLHNANIDLPWSIRLKIAIRICRGVKLLHARGILHRDLKSPNVLLGPNYQVKLTDFGLSKVKMNSQSIDASVGTDGYAAGTLPWMPPELFTLLPRHSQASDIYAMGMIFWELASRRIPFGECNRLLLGGFIAQGQTEDITKCDSKTPYEFKNVIKSCWNKDPDQRPSAADVLGTLHELCDKEDDKDGTMKEGEEEEDQEAEELFAAIERQGHKMSCTNDIPFYDIFCRTADRGDIRGVSGLGFCYHYGKGVSKDLSKAFQLLRQAADKGIPLAMFNLGVCYFHGHGVDQDQKQAAEWWRKAADQGQVNAMYNLGYCYHNGNGVDQDYKQAVEWYRKAANKDHASAMFRLGNAYYFGNGVEQDYKQAVEWHLKAADQGNANAMNNLGLYYYHGHGVDQNYENATDWFQKAANQGYADAMYNLGVCYRHGDGVEQDAKQAVEWWRKAADQGNAEAMYLVGLGYQFGNGVEQDYKQAVEWYHKAADKGIPQAMYSLGICYDNGDGVEQDYKQAVEWYHKAADKDCAEAMNNLGVCYRHGVGVEQDQKQGMEWYRKAADKGNGGAMNNLGNAYYHGRGVEQNFEQAVEWYQKAANKGHVSAMFNLGVCYYNGNGVDQDQKQAAEWWRKAADKSHEGAKAELRKRGLS